MNEVQSAIATLVKHYGSYRAVQAAIGVNYAYLWRLRKGEKTEPSEDVLKKLGLVKQVTYSRTGNGKGKRP